MMKSRLGPGGEEEQQVQKRDSDVVFNFTQVQNDVFGIVFHVFCPTSIFGHSIHILLPHLSHVAQHSEDDEAGEKTSQAVHRAGDQSISEVWVEGRRQS